MRRTACGRTRQHSAHPNLLLRSGGVGAILAGVLFVALGYLAFIALESTTKTYQGSSAQILNPERGWWYTIEPDWYTNNTKPTMTVAQLRNIKQTQGVTVIRKYYVIDDWVSQDIPYDVSDPHAVDLKMVEDDFAAVRAAGMKLIPRFIYVYNTDDPQFNHHDATEEQIMRHIDQLSPIWDANKDVLNHLQAGFVGCWGEWHTTHCGPSEHVTQAGTLTQSGVNIYHKLLTSVPANRMVAFRYPFQTAQVLGSEHLQPFEYYSGSERARAGMLDDAIAYDSNDRGTFRSDPSLWRSYMQSFAYANVMDGEPSGDTAYARQNLLSELRADHFDLLNMNMPDRANDPLYAWLKSSGNFKVIRKNLGYRFRLASVRYPASAVRRGGWLNVSATIANDGWGKAFNPRDVVLVARNKMSGKEYELPMSGDGRTHLPLGGQTKTLNLGGGLPKHMQAGSYSLFLHLADPLLPTRADYSIQLANDGVWENSTGYNDLGIEISVE